ncbi:hypothetical protein CVT24_004643 [Panaeolus cyanescens]|uniref:Uncharacterized protein n=1 Tax=Panaeolus cyanescens TaxID=181874 RepID=A0A409YSM9_9AGAR|nr:hypothetical protein CVT24_004643 [Panaeolus cyanescens]
MSSQLSVSVSSLIKDQNKSDIITSHRIRSPMWACYVKHTKPVEYKYYRNDKGFAAEISQAIQCMDIHQPYREDVSQYFGDGDEYLVRRNFAVMDVIFRSLSTPIEPFGIIDRNSAAPWVFALHVLTLTQYNIIKHGRKTKERLLSSGKALQHPWLDPLDLPVARRILSFGDELLCQVIHMKIKDSTNKDEHDIVIDWILSLIAFARFDDRYLYMPHFLPIIFSIWEKAICTSDNLHLLMLSIYQLEPSLTIDGYGLDLLDNEHPKWLDTLFPKPSNARGEYCQWQESLVGHTPALIQRLMAATDADQVIRCLMTLIHFIRAMEYTDAQRLVVNGKVFEIASDASLRGMTRLPEDEFDTSWKDDKISDLLKIIYHECSKFVPASAAKIFRSQMPDHPNFEQYKFF